MGRKKPVSFNTGVVLDPHKFFDCLGRTNKWQANVFRPLFFFVQGSTLNLIFLRFIMEILPRLERSRRNTSTFFASPSHAVLVRLVREN